MSSLHELSQHNALLFPGVNLSALVLQHGAAAQRGAHLLPSFLANRVLHLAFAHFQARELGLT
jgi:hypothetical protein